MNLPQLLVEGGPFLIKAYVETKSQSLFHHPVSFLRCKALPQRILGLAPPLAFLAPAQS